MAIPLLISVRIKNKHSSGIPWMADMNCLLCIYHSVLFIHRIIVTSVGNKVGRETWLLTVIRCQTFVKRLISSVEMEQISGELLIELQAI